MTNIVTSENTIFQEKLKKLLAVLDLAADIAHAQVNVYLPQADDSFKIIACTKPKTAFVYYQPEMTGQTFSKLEEPLLWHASKTCRAVWGKREWTAGMFTNMYVYPLCTENKYTWAIVSLEFVDCLLCYPAQNLFVNAAAALLENNQLHEVNEHYQRLSARDGLMLIGNDGVIMGVNNVIQNIYLTLGVLSLIGRKISERQLHLEKICDIQGSRDASSLEMKYLDQVFAQRMIPIYKKDQLLYTVLIMVDVTELKKKDKQLRIKSAVIQEIHHRVKNNLQSIAGLLRLQARRAKMQETKIALQESINRILSISLVHEFLSQQGQDVIDLQLVAKNIFELVTQNMQDPHFDLQRSFYAQEIILPSVQANSIALILNELIQNALEHAFVGRSAGFIGITIYADDKYYFIEVQDNGNGLPLDFSLNKQSGSLGLYIVKTLVESDLCGQFSLINNLGTLARVSIPKELKE